jgi:hypothetical protein
MKGVTFVIILSVVWSIVSSIIEKRKAAAKKEAGRVDLSGQAVGQTATPVSVKVQSLRRRKTAVPKAVPNAAPVVRSREGIQPLSKLHKEDCPIPPQNAKIVAPRPSKQFAALFSNRRNLRTAIVLTEILGKPISQR